MRLWSLADGSSTRFVGHEGDVLSCNFSADNQLIVSASRDRTVRIWDVLGQQLLVFSGPSGHNDWVSSAHLTPDANPRVISAGHDKLVKVSTFFSISGGCDVISLFATSEHHSEEPSSTKISDPFSGKKQHTNSYFSPGVFTLVSLMPTSLVTRATSTPLFLLRTALFLRPPERTAKSSSGTSTLRRTRTRLLAPMKCLASPSPRAVSGSLPLRPPASRSTICRPENSLRSFASRSPPTRSRCRSRFCGLRTARCSMSATPTTSFVCGRS